MKFSLEKFRELGSIEIGTNKNPFVLFIILIGFFGWIFFITFLIDIAIGLSLIPKNIHINIVNPIMFILWVYLPLFCIVGFYNNNNKEKVPLIKILSITAFYLILILIYSFYENKGAYLKSEIISVILGFLLYGFDLFKNENKIGVKIYNYLKNDFPLSIKSIPFIALSLFIMTQLIPQDVNSEFPCGLATILSFIILTILYSLSTKKTLSKATATKTTLIFYLIIFVMNFNIYNDLFMNHTILVPYITKQFMFLYCHIPVFYEVFVIFIISSFLVILTNKATLKYKTSKSKNLNIKNALILASFITFIIAGMFLIDKFQLGMNYFIVFLVPFFICIPGTLMNLLYKKSE